MELTVCTQRTRAPPDRLVPRQTPAEEEESEEDADEDYSPSKAFKDAVFKRPKQEELDAAVQVRGHRVHRRTGSPVRRFAGPPDSPKKH